MSTENIESVALTQTERVVVTTDQGRVIVTGMIAPRTNIAISGASDIDLSLLDDGSTLIYSSSNQKWRTTNLLDKQIMEGGQY